MFSYDLPPGLLLITSDIYSKIRFYYQQLLERFGKFILHRYGWSEEKKKRKNLFCLRITRFQCPSVMTESLGFLRLESFGVSEGSLSMSFVIIRSIWGNVWNHWDSVFFMHSVLFSLSCTQVFHIACKYWNIDIV